MILQALKEYYDRKAADPESGIAPEGFQYKEIPFVIVIDADGNLVQIRDTRRPIGKQLRAQSFLLPQEEKRSSGIKANLLWDNAEYVFGVCTKGSPEKVVERHAAFISRIHLLDCQDEGVAAILKFLGNHPIQALETQEHFHEIKESNAFVSFQLNTDTNLIPQRSAVIDKIRNVDKTPESRGICLVTGEEEPLAKLQPSIKGVRGTNTTGGNMVSFNLAAFNSYGKLQGANAPISEKAAFAYTTALNHLLRKDSTQKMQVGDATLVFWSEKASILEDNFAALLNDPPKDDPDALTNAVKALYESVGRGVMPNLEESNRFYVLGLSPNAARISVRFWLVGTVKDFSHHIIRHFEDLEIAHAKYEPEHLSLWRMLLSTAIQDKSENIAPNLAGEWMRTILTGLPYPDSLYQAVLRRIHADKGVNYPRAAIIKGYLNRKFQFTEGEIKVSLNKENDNIGYLLGRLLAVLEKMQLEALEDKLNKNDDEESKKLRRKLNSTIQDRYYSSASATPSVVFSTLMRRRAYYLRKLRSENGGKRAIYFDKLIGEILSKIPKKDPNQSSLENSCQFPAQLSLIDQGKFAIGYYHQRQDFFEKNESTSLFMLMLSLVLHQKQDFFKKAESTNHRPKGA